MAEELGAFESIMLYLETIDWTEPWIVGLISFHIVTFVVIIATKRYTEMHIGIFLSLLLGVYFAETINKWGYLEWREFASKNYFDTQGAFISLVFSGPMILNALMILILMMGKLASLLITVKRMEVKQKTKQQKKTQ